MGLWEAQGIGRKPLWTSEDGEALEKWLKEPRSISSQQLSQRWARGRRINIMGVWEEETRFELVATAPRSTR